MVKLLIDNTLDCPVTHQSPFDIVGDYEGTEVYAAFCKYEIPNIIRTSGDLADNS